MTDWCTLWPDLNYGEACCKPHDAAYDFGGSILDFLAANIELGACVAALGHPGIAVLAVLGTSTFGWIWWLRARRRRLSTTEPIPAARAAFFMPGGIMITAAQLQKLFPTAKPPLVNAILSNWSAAAVAGITSRKRKAMFLAMIGVETGGLRAIVENLNYTTAARIRETWPTRFKTDAAAQPYVRQPRKLANLVYGSRMGNRPGTDDGWVHRGSGMMQTTGRDNFAKLGFEDNPEGLRDPTTAFLSAVAEWERRRCNAFADTGRVRECRKAINGGAIGLGEATAFYARGLEIFSDDKGAMPAAAVPMALMQPLDLDEDEAAKMPSVEEEEAEAGIPISLPVAVQTPSVAETAGALAAGVSDATAPINKAIAAGQGAAQSVGATVTTVTGAAAVASSYTGFLNGINPTYLLLGFGAVLLLATVAFGAWWTFRKTFKAPPNASG